MATSESVETQKKKNEPLFPTKNPSVDTHTSSGSKKTVVLVVIVAVSDAS